jgi:hypothetical protein
LDNSIIIVPITPIVPRRAVSAMLVCVVKANPLSIKKALKNYIMWIISLFNWFAKLVIYYIYLSCRWEIVRVGVAEAKIVRAKTESIVIENCILNRLLKREE